jgi:putative Ig domain-containing protein
MRPRTLTRRWATRGGAAAVTAVALVTGMQAAAGTGAQASTHPTPRVVNPYSPAYHHPYRHGVTPTLQRQRQMNSWARSHASNASANDLNYGGGIDGIGVTTGHEKVYLVFYGSQWGTQSTNSNGDVVLSGDPSGEAPYVQEFLKGLGTGGELWSGVMTQYCDGVAVGAQTCPASNTEHVAYPTGGSLAGVWVDESTASPQTATGHQLGVEAVNAAAHFGNTTAASNRDSQYVILSPTGTNPDNWLTNGFCAWHDYNGDSTLSGGPVTSPYGDIAFTNLPYITDAGASCGQDFVNPTGTLDGVSIVEGHEYAETITDQNPPGGWTDSSGSETGDKCAWITPGTAGGSFDLTTSTGTFAVQTTWANDGSGGAGTCEGSHAIVTNPGNTVTVTNPGNQTGTVGTAVSLQIHASDSASGQTLSYSATGLPAGLSINSSSGLISGTPTTAGSNNVTVTATDTTNASGSASFTWTISPAGGNTVTVTNPGNQTGTVGTAVSLQIHASDSASGQTLSYSATGLPAGLSINSSSGLISGTPTTAGTSSVTVTATDTTGAHGSAGFSWTISSSGGGCTAQQLFGNPGFESGSISPWKATAGVLANTSEGVPAHSGSWLAWLDGYGGAHTDTLSQTVTIPSTCKNATLSFWLYINSNDPTSKAYDTFTIQVLNSSGTVLATLATLSNQQESSGYQQFSYSVAPYIGQKITIKYTGKETLGGGYDTNFFEDDNALNVS